MSTAAIQKNIREMELAQQEHLVYYVGPGADGAFSRSKIALATGNAQINNVISATNIMIQDYQRATGNAQAADELREELTRVCPLKHRHLITKTSSNGEPQSGVASIVDAFSSQNFAHPGAPRSTDSAPARPHRPPPARPPSHSAASPMPPQQLSPPPFLRPGSVPSGQEAYLYPLSRGFMEATSGPLYHKPGSDVFTLEPTDSRDAAYAYPGEACVLVIHWLRQKMSGLDRTAQTFQEKEILTRAIAQVMQKGTQTFRQTIKDFHFNADFLSDEEINESLKSFSLQLKQFALTVNPYSKEGESPSNETEVREKELQDANSLLKNVEEIHETRLTPQTLEACHKRQNCLSIPYAYERLLSFIHQQILETDFSKTELTSSWKKPMNIDPKFEHFVAELARLKGEINSLYKDGKEEQISDIGKNVCKQKVDAVMEVLIQRIDPHKEKLTPEALARFESIKKQDLPRKARPRPRALTATLAALGGRKESAAQI